ncbi:MAG TPA: tyrosine-type recombinase/integrase, partial [Chitinophagales bacterium]|nr:tyrosine-type recombinase/integrase [Chitinophagales bacterium]
MDWHSTINGFKSYLQLERSLSKNSIDAYIHDIKLLADFVKEKKSAIQPEQIGLEHLQDFLRWVNEKKMKDRSQARVISGIRAFYKFLLMEDAIQDDPTLLLEGPKLSRKLPDVLSLDEITRMIDAIDVSTPEGVRNKAMLETLYSCGLRVSELVNLKISNLFLDLEFIRVLGKGNKERLVPVGKDAVKYITLYKQEVRVLLPVKKGCDDILFLNRRGGKLSR